MALKKFFILTVTLYGLMSSRLFFADAAAVHPESDGATDTSECKKI
jgi:hypothetical protein